MLRTAAFGVITLSTCVVAAPVWAACSEHTFDPCLQKSPAYKIEVDSKTGRTWLKPAPPPPVDENGRLARLSATAKNVPAGSMSKADAPKGAWHTRVVQAEVPKRTEAEHRAPPRLK
jgi:hypothetical protein